MHVYSYSNTKKDTDQAMNYGGLWTMKLCVIHFHIFDSFVLSCFGRQFLALK